MGGPFASRRWDSIAGLFAGSTCMVAVAGVGWVVAFKTPSSGGKDSTVTAWEGGAEAGLKGTSTCPAASRVWVVVDGRDVVVGWEMALSSPVLVFFFCIQIFLSRRR